MSDYYSFAKLIEEFRQLKIERDKLLTENAELREALEKANNTLAYKEKMQSATENELAEMLSKLEKAKEIIHKIDDWAEAYPVEVFPEPDWNKVKELLGSNLLSCVSASNMRHVITNVNSLAKQALKELE